MDKYQPLRDRRISAPNVELDTAAIIARLQAWDQRYGIALSDVGGDRVLVQFETLPDDTRELAAEVYDFCPDVIDQHFGCIGELVEAAEETGMDLPENIQQLIEGVDLTEENCGLELLARSLKRDQKVPLWWD